jgi:hypothetical protein
VVLIGRVGVWLEAGTASDAQQEADLPPEAAEQLAGIDDATREPVLLQLLARAPRSVKVAAACGLGRIGTVAAVAPLVAYRDGADWSGEPKRVAREAIAQIQTRLGVEAGRLSVAAPPAGAGGLTVAEPDPAGGVSVAGESSGTSTPLRRGDERDTDGGADT